MEEKIIKGQKESWASQINGIPLNVHFYIIDKAHAGSGGLNYYPLSISGQVLNLLYYPFLKMDDIHTGAIYEYDFDQKYYGTAKINATGPEDFASPAPKVYKIYGQTTIKPKHLGDFARYSLAQRQTNKRHWSNESKLYQHPYHFVTINDYINTPLVLKNQYIPDTFNNTIPVYVYQPLTMTGGYTIYVPNYKGDQNQGANEGMLANAGLDLPTSSSEYAQFMATSKAQFIAQNEAGNRNEWTNFGRGAVSVVGGAIQTGLGAMAIGTTGGTASFLGAGSMIGAGLYAMGQGFMDMTQAHVTQTNRIEQSQALISDLMNAPRNVTMSSSDILLSLSRNGNKIVWNRYTINEYYKEKLANYWHYYGYKVNRLMTPNTKNRKYFNYIRTMNANIKSNSMDKTEIEMVKYIYNKGIRFWHQEKGNINDNHQFDNVEVNR